MAAKLGQSSTVLLLLFLASSCMAAPADEQAQPLEATSAEALAGKKLSFNLPGGLRNLLPPLLRPDVAIKECAEALPHIPGCANDVFSSFRSGEIRVSAECCSVLEGVSEGCVHAVFPFIRFYPWFLNLIHGFCIALQAHEAAAAASPPPLPSQ